MTLEIIAFLITVNYRNRQKTFFINSSNFVSTIVYNNSFKINEYFGLRYENQKLLEENFNLKNNNFKEEIKSTRIINDTSRNRQYKYITANIVKNSILSQNNYITINRGSKDGIEKDMAVVSPQGVVGIITNVSKNYSVALSVLNTLNSIGCKLKDSEYFGSATWDTKNYKYLILNGIPNHVTVNKNDTVVTSGFGYIFPENIPVGTVDTLWKNNQDNFYTIRLKLSTDLKNTSNIYLVKNLLLDEQRKLEQETKDMLE